MHDTNIRSFQAPSHAGTTWLARSLWQWLTLGAAVFLLFPGARGHSLWLGSGGFWLLAAPLVSLLTYHRHEFAAAWRGVGEGGSGLRSSCAPVR